MLLSPQLPFGIEESTQANSDTDHSTGSDIIMTTVRSNLSRRGAFYVSPENGSNALLDILCDTWDPISNPNGFLSLGVAENVRPALLRH